LTTSAKERICGEIWWTMVDGSCRMDGGAVRGDKVGQVGDRDEDNGTGEVVNKGGRGVGSSGPVVSLTALTAFPSWQWEIRAAGFGKWLKRFDVGLGKSGSSTG
jgi:hypothetical protein